MAEISVIKPIGLAWDRMVLICFKPFDLGRWFTLGFCAWLAYLGQGGGGGFNFPTGNFGGAGPGRRGGRGMPVPSRTPGELFDSGKDWVLANLTLVVAISAIVLLVGLALFLLLQWLQARGQFMFLDGVATSRRTDLVARPWKQFRKQANSLFIFRSILTLLAGLASLSAMVLCVWVAWPDIMEFTFGASAIQAIILAVFLLPVVIILGATVLACVNDFVIPIMYAQRCSFMPAWSIFWTKVVPGHMWSLTLFYAMRFLLTLSVASIAMIATCCTCCIAALPYLGTVILLPTYVLLRSYSVYYLEQFGEQYRIMLIPELPSYGFPIVPPAPLAPPMPPVPPGQDSHA